MPENSFAHLPSLPATACLAARHCALLTIFASNPEALVTCDAILATEKWTVSHVLPQLLLLPPPLKPPVPGIAATAAVVDFKFSANGLSAPMLEKGRLGKSFGAPFYAPYAGAIQLSEAAHSAAPEDTL